MIKLYSLKYNAKKDKYYIESMDRVYCLSNMEDISILLSILNSNGFESLKKENEDLENENKSYYEKLIKMNIRISSLEKTIAVYEEKLNGEFPVNAEPIKSPYRFDLKDYFRIPAKYEDKYWQEGDIIKALDYYKSDSVRFNNYVCVG